MGYVDDTMCMDKDNVGTTFSCKIIENTLDELSLEAHKDKTKHVICGNKEWVEEMTKKLENNPAEIQNFRVKVEKSEKYLGVKIVSGEICDIINANIKFKSSKSYQAATAIRQRVRDIRMERVGALQASALLLRSVIVPILTYATECWLHTTDKQYHEMEMIMAQAMSIVLSIPKNSCYEAMLLEIQGYHLEQWMDCLKLCYFSKKIHVKKSGILYNIIKKDIAREDLTGFVGDVKKLCAKYKLPDVTLLPLRTRYIKSACKDLSRRRCMMATLTNKKVPSLLSPDQIDYNHYNLGVMEARAITVMRTGNLIFKNWAHYKFSKKHMGDDRCMVPTCRERDTLNHVMKCEYYDTKFTQIHGNVKDWAEYLVALNNERIKKFGQPLISCEGWTNTR